MNINDRIRLLRKTLDLSGEKFGEKIGLKKVAISQIETGKSMPTEQTILSICREFNVSEDWLRNGEGEMFVSLTLDEEIASFIGDMQADVEPTFKKRFASALAKLSPEEWKTIEHIMRNMIDEREKEEVKE